MPTPPESDTLGSWLKHWIDVYAPVRCRSLKTIERYRSLASYLTSPATPELGTVRDTPLVRLTHIELEAGLLSLLTAPAIKRAHLSPRTIHHIGEVLGSALHKAYLLDLIRENPMLKVELPRCAPAEARALIPAEILALRAACRGWTSPFVELALATGCRRGELLALLWSDFDFGARILSISKSLEQTRAGIRVKAPKNGKSRRLTVPVAAMAALQAWRTINPPRRLVFAGTDGAHLHPDLVSQMIVRRLRKAGIQDASLHTLRHTHASNLLSRGVPLPEVSRRLGHADVSITARLYSHALPPDDRRAADQWDELLATA